MAWQLLTTIKSKCVLIGLVFDVIFVSGHLKVAELVESLEQGKSFPSQFCMFKKINKQAFYCKYLKIVWSVSVQLNMLCHSVTSTDRQ